MDGQGMIFEKPLPERSMLRRAIDAHHRADETQSVRGLLSQARSASKEEEWGLTLKAPTVLWHRVQSRWR